MQKNNNGEHERIEIFRNYFSLSTTAIDQRSQYYAYGIIVGLFSFKGQFFHNYSFLGIITAFFSILSLILSYLRYLYFYRQSDKILIENAKYPIKKVARGKDSTEAFYQGFRNKSAIFFIIFQLSLFISILFFIISAYYNFLVC